LQEFEIAAMCAKEDIDNVSRDRHGAKCGVDHQVPERPRKNALTSE